MISKGGDCLDVLRSCTLKRSGIKQRGETLYLGSQAKFDLKTETAWQSQRTKKRYNLGQLWLFLDFELNGKTLGKEYMEKADELGLEIVNTLDRDEILKYFRGEVESTLDINPEFKLLKSGGEDRGAVSSDPETMAVFRLLEWSQKHEKAVESKSRQMRTSSRSYNVIIELFKEMDEKKRADKSREKPIVIVPQVEIPGNVCMRNIRQFLLDGEYLEPEKCPEVVEQKLDISYRGRVLEIINNADYLDENQWGRVVAIFVTGRKSQFDSWPMPNLSLSALFSKHRAFYVKWLEAAMGEAKDWNLCVLNVHAIRKHENRELQKRFWAELNAKLQSQGR